MAENGHARVDQDHDQNTPDKGFWKGDIGGTLIQRIWPWADHLKAWRKAAIAFVDFCFNRQDDFRDGLIVLTHSHGGHVLVMALVILGRAFPFPVYVIDIDMPVQRPFRMPQKFYTHAVASVESWTHVFSGRGWKSKFRWLGNFFNTRRLDFGAKNIGPVTGGHSGILQSGDGDHLVQLGVIVRKYIP